MLKIIELLYDSACHANCIISGMFAVTVVDGYD